MFENLTERLQGIFRRLRKRGKLSEADVNEALREVRMALLEADVNLKVVKDFINRVKEKAIGQEVLESLTPAQSVIKIVDDELTKIMGEEFVQVEIASQPPTIIMLVGLQGSGKTTTAGKLALYFQAEGHKPILVAADIYRPAAIKQLEVLGKSINIPVFSMGKNVDPVVICKEAVKYVSANDFNVLVIDTAGRLHIDEEMMQELKRIKDSIKPTEILLVVDSMTGQDAVNVAEEFNRILNIDGTILTKLDGDARGGAALSIKAVTGKPIKFVGVGEKLKALEPFHPDRMASRILGMGDILTLIEKTQEAVDARKAEELERKLRAREFTLEDYLEQLQHIKRMGPLDQLINMLPSGLLPGLGSVKQLRDLKVDEKQLTKIEAIINSMTREERRNPLIIKGSRRKRIAYGSGTTVSDVNRVLKHYEQIRKLFQRFSDLEKEGKKKGFGFPFPL